MRPKKLAGDLGLGAAGGEQLAGLQTDAFERLAVAQAAGVAAVGVGLNPPGCQDNPGHVVGKGEAL